MLEAKEVRNSGQATNRSLESQTSEFLHDIDSTAQLNDRRTISSHHAKLQCLCYTKLLWGGCQASGRSGVGTEWGLGAAYQMGCVQWKIGNGLAQIWSTSWIAKGSLSSTQALCQRNSSLDQRQKETWSSSDSYAYAPTYLITWYRRGTV